MQRLQGVRRKAPAEMTLGEIFAELERLLNDLAGTVAGTQPLAPTASFGRSFSPVLFLTAGVKG